jgi:hypothetical protein
MALQPLLGLSSRRKGGRHQIGQGIVSFLRPPAMKCIVNSVEFPNWYIEWRNLGDVGLAAKLYEKLVFACLEVELPPNMREMLWLM